MSLKEKYEELFREVIDSLPDHEVNSRSAYMQALKYFFTHLCNHGISPDSLTKKDIESFFLLKYSTGKSERTLKSYFSHIHSYFLSTKMPTLKFDTSQVDRWIEKWEDRGVPTVLIENNPLIIISYKSDIKDLLAETNQHHPRK